MSDSNSRTIKIDFKVDTQSLLLAKTAVRELTAELEKLGKSTVGIGGRGGINVNSGGGTQNIGSGNTTVKGGDSGLRSLKVPADVIASLRQLGTESKKAFTELTTNLTNFIQNSAPHFTKLNAELGLLKNNLQAIKASGNVFQMTSINSNNNIQSGNITKGTSGGGVGGVIGGGGGGGLGGGGSGWGGGAAGGGNIISKIIDLAKKASPIAAWETMAGAVTDVRANNYSFEDRKASFNLDRDSAYGQMSSAAEGMRLGGYSTALANSRLAGDDRYKEFRELYSDKNAKKRQELAEIRALDPTATGSVGDLGKKVMNNIGVGLSNGIENRGDKENMEDKERKAKILAREAVSKLMMGSGGMGGWTSNSDDSGTPSGGDSYKTNLEIAAEDAKQKEALAAPARYLGAIQKLKDADPRTMRMIDEVGQNAKGYSSIARTAGFGGFGQTYTRKDGVQADRGMDLQSRLAGKGIDMGEWAGAVRQGGMSAGWGNRFAAGGEGLINLQSGGMSNAANIFGLGARLSGGSGRETMKAMQSTVGKGGLDVVAGSALGEGVLSKILASGLSGMSGTSALKGFASAAYTGSAGSDLRQSELLTKGLAQSNQNTLGGGMDQFQGALNMYSANEAMGGKGLYAKKAVMNLSAEERAEIVRSGKVPPELAKMGVSADDVKSYQKSQFSNLNSRVMAEELQGTEAGTVLKEMQDAGDPTSYMKKKLAEQGITSSKQLKTKAGSKALADIKSGMKSVHIAGGRSAAESEGLIGEAMASDSMLGGDLKGKGAGGSGVKGVYDAALKQDAERLKKESELLAKEKDNFTTVIKNINTQTAPAFDNLNKSSKHLGVQFEDAAAVMNNFILSVNSYLPKGNRFISEDQEKTMKIMKKAEAPKSAPAPITIPAAGQSSHTAP